MRWVALDEQENSRAISVIGVDSKDVHLRTSSNCFR